MTKIAFLGLGVMGYPMAGHLANAGYDITVYNRTNSKAKKWILKSFCCRQLRCAPQLQDVRPLDNP